MSLTIGLDFDGTTTRHPRLFVEFCELVARHGAAVIVTTHRCFHSAAKVRQVLGPDIPIVFCSGLTKLEAVRLAGYTVDIWIDDNPAAVYTELVHICEQCEQDGTITR